MTDTSSQPAAELLLEPFPLRARAVWQGQVVAESTSAVRVLDGGRAVGLGFPGDDVRWDLLTDEQHEEQTVTGPARLFGLPGTAPNPRGSVWSAAQLGATVNGGGAVRRHDAAGIVVFDHDRVRVELVDGPVDGDERDTTVKLFPVWGDLDDMVRVMDVRREDDGSWTGVPAGDNEARPVAEASQLLGQALVAAVRQTGGRRPVSAHMAFFRVVDPRHDIRFELTELNAGRTFTTLDVKVFQAERMRAAGTFLMDVTSPDAVQHVDPAPPCDGPYDSTPYDMGVLGRDLRVADAAYTDDPAAPVGPPVLDAWVRFTPLPDDPALHVGLLAQFTGHMSIAAALRPHEGVGQAQAHVTLSTGVSALHFALHRDVRVDQWIRYHHHAVTVNGGMSHAANAAYDEHGTRLASFSCESLLRPFAGGGSHDARTAI